MKKFYIDFNKSKFASVVTWLDSTISIEECNLFISDLRCDSGDDYYFYKFSPDEISTQLIINYEAIKNESNDYYLCYIAEIFVKDDFFDSEFFSIANSNNLEVEVVVGFKDRDGNIIHDCYEDAYVKSVILAS